MWKSEWDFWTSDLAELKVDEHIKTLFTLARKYLLPIRGQLDLVDRETVIVPGIHAIAAPGHTVGQMALVIHSRGQQLLCIADAMLHSIHTQQPDWYAAVDFIPSQVANTRRRLLNKAATEEALVLGFHFLFPGLGYIVQKGEGWQWKPMNSIILHA